MKESAFWPVRTKTRDERNGQRSEKRPKTSKIAIPSRSTTEFQTRRFGERGTRLPGEARIQRRQLPS